MDWPNRPPNRSLRILLAGCGIMGHQSALALSQHPAVQWLGIVPWETTMACGPDTGKQPESVAFLNWANSQPGMLPCPNGINGHAQLLNQLKPDLVILATWGEILNKETLQTIPCPVINLHPALLPNYRGANPYSACLLNNDSQTGLTLHEVTTVIDGGPILLHHALPVLPTDTGGSLRSRMAETCIAPIIHAFLDDWHQQRLTPSEQLHHHNAPAAPSLKLWDGELDPYQHTSEALARQLRAYHPWLPCFTHVYARRKLLSSQSKLLLVMGAPGHVLHTIEGGAIGEITYQPSPQPQCIIRCNDYRSLAVPLQSAYWGEVPIGPRLFNVLLPSLIGPSNACITQP